MGDPINATKDEPLLPPQPWYLSEVQVRLVIAGIAQLVSIVFRTLPLFGIHIDVDDGTLDVLFANITQGVAGIFGILAIMKRQNSPIQPLTMTKAGAAQKADIAKIDPVTLSPKQGGFARVSMLALLVAFCGALIACTGTRLAYKEAQGLDEQAYVAVEHYASLVREANQLANRPGTHREAIAAMQKADRAALPVVTQVRQLRDAYAAVKNADNEAALQEAVNNAILLIADMVRAVKDARGEP